MDHRVNRREFLYSAAGAAAFGLGLSGLAHAAPILAAEKTDATGVLKKGIILGMLPGDLSLEDRLKLAKEVGFDGVEAPPLDEKQAAELRAASDATGVPIHSVIFGGWNAPLSSGDPKTAETGRRQLEDGLRCAHALGADTLLLVPAMVNADTRYQDAYTRSQAQIRKALPLARELGVVIAVENVWNNFLLSPMEFARYVDEFKSPYLKAYFDVGNVVAFGWPQDWIYTLGKRIRRIHLKDFTRNTRAWVPLREGDVQWQAVRQALAAVGYSGYLTVELPGGNADYLREVSKRVDLIIAGA